jgi:hypothetical protein
MIRGRGRAGFGEPSVEFVPWKPDVCEEDGCAERHPAFSRDGMAGPWRCATHDATATRSTDPDPFAPMPAKQDRLL